MTAKKQQNKIVVTDKPSDVIIKHLDVLTRSSLLSNNIALLTAAMKYDELYSDRGKRDILDAIEESTNSLEVLIKDLTELDK